MVKYVRILFALILTIAIILSCTVMGNKMTDPISYSRTIEALDRNRSTVLGLTAAVTAASAAVSLLPDDICTPLANELSEFSSWFLLILSVSLLEKYLLTIFGFVACYILFPGGCGALLINCFFPRKILRSIGVKLLAFGCILLTMIPVSVMASNQINEVYEESIQITVASAEAVSDNLVEDMPEGADEGTTIIDEAKLLLNASTSGGGVIKQFKTVLNRFVEATAVMLVTTCFIPILVVLFFIWSVKKIFGIQIIIPEQVTKPMNERFSRRERESENKVDCSQDLQEITSNM